MLPLLPLAALLPTGHPFLLQEQRTSLAARRPSGPAAAEFTSLPGRPATFVHLKEFSTSRNYTLPLLLLFKCAFLQGAMVIAVTEFYLLML